MISTPGNLTNGKTASLTLRDNDRSAYASLSPTRLVNTSRLWLTGHADFFGEANLFEGFAQHAAVSVAGERDADGLGDERYDARCTRSDTFFCWRSRTYMCGRAILQGLPCAPTVRPRGSCNQASLRESCPQGVTIPNANAICIF